MIKLNGVEIVEMANSHGLRQGVSNSPTMQAACDRFLISRGIDPKDGSFRRRISGDAEAAVARKKARGGARNVQRPTSNVQRSTEERRAA